SRNGPQACTVAARLAVSRTIKRPITGCGLRVVYGALNRQASIDGARLGISFLTSDYSPRMHPYRVSGRFAWLAFLAVFLGLELPDALLAAPNFPRGPGFYFDPFKLV